MAYYHVLVSLNDPQEKLRCVFSDLTEEKLLERFIKPYRQARNLFSANEIIEVSNIRKVQIIKTDRNSEIELKEIQEKHHKEYEELNRNSSVFFVDPCHYGCNLEDIIEAGTDVTESYIIGPPGNSINWYRFGQILNNPWISSIGTGLIVAAIVWWLGWS